MFASRHPCIRISVGFLFISDPFLVQQMGVMGVDKEDALREKLNDRLLRFEQGDRAAVFGPAAERAARDLMNQARGTTAEGETDSVNRQRVPARVVPLVPVSSAPARGAVGRGRADPAVFHSHGDRRP